MLKNLVFPFIFILSATAFDFTSNDIDDTGVLDWINDVNEKDIRRFESELNEKINAINSTEEEPFWTFGCEWTTPEFLKQWFVKIDDTLFIDTPMLSGTIQVEDIVKRWWGMEKIWA